MTLLPLVRIRHKLPPQIILGLGLIAVAWPVAWLQAVPLSYFTFLYLWLGYILTLDGLNVIRQGSSPLTRAPLHFALLFALSAPVWWLFEFLNNLSQNWHYLGGQVYGTYADLVATVHFATVIPAVFETWELVRSFDWTQRAASLRPTIVNRPLEVVKRAIDVIKKLDPRPGLRYNKTEPRLVEPDVYFRKVDAQWQAFLNEDDMPQLRLSPTYRRLLVKDAADRDVRNYVKERFTAAVQLMKNIEQRKHTILRVCQSIIARQGEFLDHGPDALKPMMIKEVAEEVGVHPSTVSRAVASKYAHTPQGVLELRSFFSESVNGPEGGGMSLLTLKRLVKKMIEEEDSSKPLTDEQIAKKLDDAGIHVTRRTVAKYREDMRIPSTHQRRVKS